MSTGSRLVAVLATAAVLSLSAACSADDPYCEAVKANRSTLDSFGSEVTDAAYASYATALTSIGKVAPKPIDEQWASLSRATQGVITAQDDVGFPLQDMDDEKKRQALSQGDITVLNKAYKRFNATTKQRKAVVADVLKTCDIDLK